MHNDIDKTLDGTTTSDVVDLRGILLLLRRQIRLIGLVAALVLGVALVYLITATPVYTARTLLMVDPSQRNLLDPAQIGTSSAQSDNAKIDSEVEILRSPATALAVISAADLIRDQEFGPRVSFITRIKIALGLESDAPPTRDTALQGVIQRLSAATSVRRLGLTYLIAVDVTSTDPERAANIANTMAKSYISNQVQSKISASLSASDVLQQQVDAGREAVANSDAALDSFIEENLAALEEDSGNPRIAELRANLQSKRERLLSYETSLTAASTGLQERNFDVMAQNLANDAVNELLAQREAIASQLIEAAEGSQDLIDLQAALAGIEDELQRSANDAIVSLRGNVTAQNNEIADLRAELRTTLLQSDLSSQSLAQIFELQQAASNARTQYQNILARLSELENQAAVQVAQSRVVSEALPPTSKSAPNTRLILALALVAGLGLGIGIAFLNEYYVGGIVNPAQLEQLTGLQVASVIPKVVDAAHSAVAAKITEDPMSNYAESIRRLRAVIDQGLRGKWRERDRTDLTGVDAMSDSLPVGKGKVIMVTSSVPAEGKSTLSLSLARVYAMTGLKVIIVDADLRKPTIASLMNYDAKVGLLDFLLDPASMKVASDFGVSKDPLTPLYGILGAGRAKVPTDQLLSSLTFVSMIDKLRLNYDIIVIDTPPLLPVVDARYVAYHADAIVLPVRWAATSQSDLRGALASIKQIVGNHVKVHLALNQNEQAAGGYGYGYGYGSYYGEGD